MGKKAPHGIRLRHTGRPRSRRHAIGGWCTFIVLLHTVMSPPLVSAASIAQALAERRAQHDAARATQATISALQSGGGPVLTVEDRTLATAVAQAQQQLDEATARQQELQQALARAREAQAGIVPMLHDMVDLLERSVAVDLPFASDARREQIAQARAALSRHELTMADRFDAVVGAYRHELAYGYNSEVGHALLPVDGSTRLVNTLRIGRVALYYVTDDSRHCGVYRSDKREYATLSAAQCQIIRAASEPHQSLLALTRLPVSVSGP